RTATGAKLDTFIQSLDQKASSDLLRAVYEHFSRIARPGFPVLASDDLGRVYGIVGEDVPDEIRFLASRCGISLPIGRQLPEVQTVAGAVELLQSVRKHAAAYQGNAAGHL